MIIWDKLKLQNNNGLIELTPSANYLDIDKGLSISGSIQERNNGPIIFNTQGITLPSGNIALTSGNITLTNGNITVTSTDDDHGKVSSAVVDTTEINASIINTANFYVTTKAGSEERPIPILYTNNLRADSVTLKDGNMNLTTCHITERADLPSDTFVNGRALSETCFIPSVTTGILLDAYQGPGANWIKLQNITSDSVTINSLSFSGNTWSTFTIAANATWYEEKWDGWGMNDNPMDIQVTYRHRGSEHTTTIASAAWSAAGWVALDTGTVADPKYRTVAKTSDFWIATGIHGSAASTAFETAANAEGYTNVSRKAITDQSNVYWFVAQKPTNN